MPEPTRITIAGAGSIGCFTGGLLAAAGLPVTLLARDRIIGEITNNGLTLTDYTGLAKTLPADALTLTTSPGCLATAGLILVTVKTAATAGIAADIARHARSQIPVVSLQNGLDAVETLRAALPGHDVRAAMVPFNVVPESPGHYHRASSGDIVIGAGPGHIAAALSVPGLPISEHRDITALQWGKLLINLNNALNALSGLPVQKMLLSRDWRYLMADQMAEALQVLRAAGIHARSTTPLPAALIPPVLRLPTWAFSRIAAQMLTIDPVARTSMAYDLQNRRPTEIDSLQGRIIALGKTHAIPTPICTRVAQEITRATQPGLHPDMLR